MARATSVPRYSPERPTVAPRGLKHDDLTSGAAADCNNNGVPDSCDITNGAIDKDANGQPDDCQYAHGDFDLSGDIGGGDLGTLLSRWGPVQ
jgi:hypothetical protein